ncbi:TorF family putative porin [Nevskia sp.]|uniref:TorF family putative porin n=1 Tax=Nevskia sp. TaxID=1929292 RepID=UPI003F72EDE6
MAKFPFVALASCAVLAWCPAALAGPFDLRVAVASEEVFRGQVQNNSATLSLRADYRFDNRAYVGSRVLNNRSAGDAEIDVYAGWGRSWQLFDLWLIGVDGGLDLRTYSGDRQGPATRDLDWAEARLAVDSGPLRLSLSAAPDYFGTGAAGWRVAGQLRWPITRNLAGTGIVGWNDGAGLRRQTARLGSGRAYADYSFVLNWSLPADLSLYGQLTGASTKLDDSRRPRLLLGLQWRWGVQLP